MNGWNGKVLDIDLWTLSHITYPLDMEMARQYIGGRGLGARMLWDLVGPDVDPLDPENVLIFTNGPLNPGPVTRPATASRSRPKVR